MGAVYSTRFVGGQVSSPATLSYTVPAGKVCVVRCITILNAGAGAVTCSVGISGGFQVHFVNPLASLGFSEWQGRAVFNAGETFVCAANGPSVQFHVSGYLLALP